MKKLSIINPIALKRSKKILREAGQYDAQEVLDAWFINKINELHEESACATCYKLKKARDKKT